MISIEEAIDTLDTMIVGYRYHVYDDKGNVDPKYERLLTPLEALLLAKAALEEKVGG